MTRPLRRVSPDMRHWSRDWSAMSLRTPTLVMGMAYYRLRDML
jgi:hypothetical protein